MLHFFRSIRRSFFQPGKFRTYFAYAFGEILLIVVGILIAVEIGDWNQARKDFAEETKLLRRLKTEFTENQRKLTENQTTYKTISQTMRGFLDVLKPDPDPVSDDMIHQNMAWLRYSPGFKPNKGALDSLISSGKIALIKDETLNYKLNTWPTELQDYHEWLRRMNETSQEAYQGSIQLHQWKDSGKATVEEQYAGPSHFAYDQKALLSFPILETAVENKRVYSIRLLESIDSLLALQQEILDLIDAELAGRGISSN